MEKNSRRRCLFVILFTAAVFGLISFPGAGTSSSEEDTWKKAERNGMQANEAFLRSRDYVRGWLAHADPKSGLIPRNLDRDPFWNAQDAAADNYPFMVLTSALIDRDLFEGKMRAMLEAERRLTSRVGPLPDDFLFSTQSFRHEEVDVARLIFGASEYVKDGLLPLTEWLGPSPWQERMLELVDAILEQASVQTPVGPVPASDHEVGGEMMQVLSRLFWMTGKEEYRSSAFRLADYFLFHALPTRQERLSLDDHGCEVIGGLSEAYFLAAGTDPERHKRYQKPMHDLLDRILEVGRSPDGLFYMLVNPVKGEVLRDELTDNWGYDYNAFLTVADVDGHDPYREAVRFALENLHRSQGYPWEGGGADGYADSVESALNLLNRIPVESAFAWVDAEAGTMFAKQQEDGVIEGWHGDGNFARTALMYALWKTQGCRVEPWRADVSFGGVSVGDELWVSIRSKWPWKGCLVFDRPRHSEYLHLPADYPRLNQFPEWFTAVANVRYRLAYDDGKDTILCGKDMWEGVLIQSPGGEKSRVRIRISPNPVLRQMAYSSRSPEEAVRWQEEVRASLFKLLKLEDLVSRQAPVPLVLKILREEGRDGYRLQELEMSSTSGRSIPVVLTVPDDGGGPFPAVVCIHGHGGSRTSVHDRGSIYKGFASALAESGFITVAADVGQHEVYEQGRSLMGERLWDLMRCVDLLLSLDAVDKTRIGCAGLSLGGEMAMWLGAMDTRVKAVLSSGFLTVMDQLEQNHCPCWKFDGLRELVDFADIYALIAPRLLLCQNGLKEGPKDFTVPLAREAMDEIRVIYRDFRKLENAALDVHEGGHEIDLPGLLDFFRKTLAVQDETARKGKLR